MGKKFWEFKDIPGVGGFAKYSPPQTTHTHFQTPFPLCHSYVLRESLRTVRVHPKPEVTRPTSPGPSEQY